MCVEENQNKILPLVCLYLCTGCMDGCGLVRWLPGTRFAWFFPFFQPVFCFLVCMPSLSIKTEFIVANGVRTLTTFSHIISLFFTLMNSPVWPPWIIPQNFRIETVWWTYSVNILHFDPILLRVKVSKQWDHTLCLYILSFIAAHREQVFNSFYACILYSCVWVSSFVFIQA